MNNWPNLSSAKLMAIDTETYDPELLDAGPGWGRNKGHVVGISVAVDNQSWYFPIRHEGGGNLPLENVLMWASDNISGTPDIPKVFANAQYDVGWLRHEGIPVVGRLHDVQLAEPLIDEYARSYSLDNLAMKYLQQHKEDQLYAVLHGMYGGRKDRSQAGNIWRAPSSVVEGYAKKDAALLLGILPRQLDILDRDDLMDVYDLECELLPLLVDMRWRGVRVDVEKAQRVYDEFGERLEKLQRPFGEMSVYAAAELAAYCDKKKIEYGRTATGQPSFQGAWLREHLPQVAEIRRLAKARDTFIKGYILDKHVNGRLHGQFNQLRSDDYGTVSGRLSSSSPNLQNIPARDEEIGPLIRSMFLPDEDEVMAAMDWSQIEFRMFVHYSNDADLTNAYKTGGVDFHTVVAEMFGNLIPRKIIKNFNFMLLYGGGVGKLAAMLSDNMTEEGADGLLSSLLESMPEIDVNADEELYMRLARVLFQAYRLRFPAAKKLAELASRTAERRGFVKTLLGRRARFDLWVPTKWGADRETGVSRDEAYQRWGNKIARSGTHKALNRILQGSSADIMKTAMVNMVRSGVTDVLGPPLLTVHDELVFSIPQTPEAIKAAEEAGNIMRHCMGDLIRVPLEIDDERGPNWGEVE